MMLEKDVNKKVSILLIIGIVFLPIVFAWFTLKEGYSKRAQGISFIWMLVTLILAFNDSTKTPPQASSQPSNQSTAPTNSSSINYDLAKTLSNKKAQSYLEFAKDYNVIDVYDYSFAGRKRIRVSITAKDAHDYNAFIGTSIQAAREMMLEYRAHQIDIHLEHSKVLAMKGYQMAMVTYTPDGKGNSGKSLDGKYWEARAIKQDYPTLQLKASELWAKNKDKFKKTDGLIDEPRLDSFIADRLSIAKEDVRLLSPNYIVVKFY
ncbi:DUF4875 domain-containing protein [Shewanella surugensis]|uniref:DUF4875 domain-containing protein n=1 Tax=Shewanella surugensis TaxID=212020 RepID=A0ABT0L6Z8_9GAMM|nr:DUF4875 domain-containing protein [Shewanella surugensis]MCL1123339.1 DUF4875 domain-containing protein [Shewanella surugensis]